jgi:hypothetical protein
LLLDVTREFVTVEPWLLLASQIAITAFFMSKDREVCTAKCPTPNASNPIVSALDWAYGENTQ